MAEINQFEQIYKMWEKKTGSYLEKVLRNKSFLKASSEALNSGLKNKVVVDRALLQTWKNLLLPNKKDQEKTLHLLNELHGRIFDLEAKLDDLKIKSDQAQAPIIQRKKTTKKKTTSRTQ